MRLISYTHLHYPLSIVEHTVWLHLRFNASLRDVEDFLAERGLDVSYETVRRWVARLFGPAETRAPNVVEYLMAAGVDRRRMEYEDHGEAEPVTPNDTPEGRERNRRVDIHIAPLA